MKREGMSRAHLNRVRELPCLICGADPAGDPHHLKRVPGARGMGMKTPDRYAVPLCRPHHEAIEVVGDDVAWLGDRGFEALTIAHDLWEARKEPSAMRAVIHRARAARACLTP